MYSVNKFLKRLFDIVVSFVAILILVPVWLIVAIAIKCDSKGPAIFVQKRFGKNGVPFNFYKFRSMRTEALGSYHLSKGIGPRAHRIPRSKPNLL